MTLAVDCWNELLTKVRTVPDFLDKTEAVWSEDDLLAILKGAKSPMAGVVYNGIAANSLDPSRQGMAGDYTCTVLIVVENNAVGREDDKFEALRLLDAVRKVIRMTVAPTGHKWRFVREGPKGKLGNKLIYTQTWATSIILTGP